MYENKSTYALDSCYKNYTFQNLRSKQNKNSCRKNVYLKIKLRINIAL